MAIRAFNGLLGQGKTYNMVADSVPEFRKNRPQIYTNMAGLRCPEAIYLDNIADLCEINEGLVLLDEAAIIIPARFWQTMGRDLLTRFNQLRKHGLDLWYTAQREEAIDVNLKDLTNEFIRCRRAGAFCVRQSKGGIKDKSPASTITRFSPKIFKLYNTLETIGAHGGSTGGTISKLAQSRASSERSERLRAVAAATVKPPKSLIYQGWDDVYRLRDSAAIAFVWLEENGLFDPAREWHEQVRTELARREWLAVWGLGPDDAPHDCTPENPWLCGYDPATRQEESSARALEEAEDVVKVETRKRTKAAGTGKGLSFAG